MGKRPIFKVHQRYQWSYLYAFAPQERRGSLADLTHRERGSLLEGAGELCQGSGSWHEKRILLVVDRAGWHTAKMLKVPEGIHLEFLPSHSPELQPAERLWPLSNEGVANRYFVEIEELEEALVERCLALLDQPEVIRSYSVTHKG